jgi:hypothetical protein
MIGLTGFLLPPGQTHADWVRVSVGRGEILAVRTATEACRSQVSESIKLVLRRYLRMGKLALAGISLGVRGQGRVPGQCLGACED